jgi:hypothetical protein
MGFQKGNTLGSLTKGKHYSSLAWTDPASIMAQVFKDKRAADAYNERVRALMLSSGAPKIEDAPTKAA